MIWMGGLTETHKQRYTVHDYLEELIQVLLRIGEHHFCWSNTFSDKLSSAPSQDSELWWPIWLHQVCYVQPRGIYNMVEGNSQLKRSTRKKMADGKPLIVAQFFDNQILQWEMPPIHEDFDWNINSVSDFPLPGRRITATFCPVYLHIRLAGPT